MKKYGNIILYHYTDFQALDGILRCAQLRVNNVLRMNDSAEMRHFMRRLCSAIMKRLENDGDFNCAHAVQTLFEEELKKEYSAFAACFSFHRNDAAQWEPWQRSMYCFSRGSASKNGRRSLISSNCFLSE